MLLRRGHNRGLVFCLASLAAFVLFCYHRGSLAKLGQMTTWAAPARPPTTMDTDLDRLTGDAELEIVLAAMRTENITWLNDYLLQWPKNLYAVDDPDAKLKVPKNKGREAMVILTYIIDRYNTLPANIIFHHAERFQWHNDDPDYDALQLLKRFRIPYLQSQGYVNLRCAWTIGCPAEIRPAENQSDEVVDANDVPTARFVFGEAFRELFPGRELPAEVGVPCCSQFAVTRETVRARPREDYLRYREWLLNTELPDAISGRVFEYAWHIIFNKDPVYCPHAGTCYCKLYGMCEKPDCDERGCPGQYKLPQYASLPEGWPKYGWEGEDRHWHGEL